jgi:hypothetical protein
VRKYVNCTLIGQSYISQGRLLPIAPELVDSSLQSVSSAYSSLRLSGALRENLSLACTLIVSFSIATRSIERSIDYRTLESLVVELEPELENGSRITEQRPNGKGMDTWIHELWEKRDFDDCCLLAAANSTGSSLLPTVLYCTVLYCTVLYCTVLYCTLITSEIHKILPTVCLETMIRS